MDYDVEKNPYSTFYKSRQNRMIAVNSKTNFLKSLHFGYFKNSGMTWVTRIPKTVIRKMRYPGLWLRAIPTRISNSENT